MISSPYVTPLSSLSPAGLTPHNVTPVSSDVTPPVEDNTSKELPGNISVLGPDHPHCVFEVSQMDTLLSVIQDHSIVCDHALVCKQMKHNGHVVEFIFTCGAEHNVTWQTSSKLGNNYLVNYKFLMAYLCSGILPVQYQRFADFGQIGVLTDHFLKTRLVMMAAIITLLAKESMTKARGKEIMLSQNAGLPPNTLNIMTDHRHHNRKNSNQSQHVTLGEKTHQVIDHQIINKEMDKCSQRHEAMGAKLMYDTFDNLGIHVNKHIHDRNLSVNKIIRERGASTINTNERWHATKAIASGIRKVSLGSKKSFEAGQWHPELRDKGALTKNHVYWCIENCQADGTKLRKLIDVAILHFQNMHTECDNSAKCKLPGYLPSFTVIKSDTAKKLLTKFLHSLVVYQKAEDFAASGDTYYVESFNNTCLIYLDKRVHYGDTMFELRAALAVLDWNEHVDRPYTSIHRSISANRPRQHRGSKVYKKKTYSFVNDIWDLVVQVVSDGNDNDSFLPEDNVEQTDDEDDSCD